MLFKRDVQMDNPFLNGTIAQNLFWFTSYVDYNLEIVFFFSWVSDTF